MLYNSAITAIATIFTVVLTPFHLNAILSVDWNAMTLNIKQREQATRSNKEYKSTIDFCLYLNGSLPDGNGRMSRLLATLLLYRCGYVLGIILSAYRDFESRIILTDDKIPALEQVRNAINEKIGKFTKSELMEFVPTIGKASIENSLKRLVEEDFIERYGKGKATFYTRTNK